MMMYLTDVRITDISYRFYSFVGKRVVKIIHIRKVCFDYETIAEKNNSTVLQA